MSDHGSFEGPALEVEGVSFSYGQKPALVDVSLKLYPGAFTALLGANGAGKTTLLSLITRLFDTRQGDIRIAGRSLRQHGSRALAPLGVVFQQQTLDLDLTVTQNLTYFAGLRGMPRSLRRRRVEAVLQQLDIAQRARDKVRKLSGGQRRRVEVARALLHEPDILVLDEPTVGLDIPTRRALIEQVHAMAGDRRIAVLWATHLVDEVEDDDHLVVLDEGRVIADDTVSGVVAAAGASSLEEAFHALGAAMQKVS